MDSTTIYLFSNVLKGIGCHPKDGRRKEALKYTRFLKLQEEFLFRFSAATHNHVMLKKLELSSGGFIAMDRAYIDY